MCVKFNTILGQEDQNKKEKKKTKKKKFPNIIHPKKDESLSILGNLINIFRQKGSSGFSCVIQYPIYDML